jgi:S1-C subfamily serine protease
LGVAVASRPSNARNGGKTGIGGGAQVQTVAPNGPAARAGVREGDVIVGFRDQPVRSNDDLLNLLDATAIGQDLPLRVERGRRELHLTIRPREQENS